MTWNSYWRLMRFHKPVGILLLWYPTAWALWLAYSGKPPFSLIVLFLSGTILMRAAGCVVNDMADSKIDLQVKRTKMRPLATGEVSPVEAFLLLVSLLFLAFIILLLLPGPCFFYALIGLFITFLYPFCKRFFAAPQLVLSLAFSMGIPMVFSAANLPIHSEMLYLFLINILWIVAYDTQYAMVDREDDLRIGVKSTAILFAKNDCVIVGILQLFAQSLWLCLAISQHFAISFYYLWLMGCGILLYQQKLIASRHPDRCLRAFNFNAWYGLIMWLALLTSLLDV